MATVEHAYAAADLFTFVPIYEPSANVCFEALAAGLPVVTSSQNGAGEVLRGGQTGSIITSPADIPAIVRAIQFWKNRPPARLTGLDFDLSMERNVAQTISILEDVANETNTPALKDSPA
jgi:UDP-glucose:(heptosyl)LPS alpha-1,3-glucosyltransferase